MTRKFEVGPLLVTLGALLLVVSLFTSWYKGYAYLEREYASAWQVFEVWDLVLLVLAAVAIVTAVRPFENAPDRRLLAAVCAAAFVIVVSQIVNPPFPEMTPVAGIWIALAATVVLGAGALLTVARVGFSMTVSEREAPDRARQRVSAVDARGPADPTTDDVPKVSDGEASVPAASARDDAAAPDAGGGGRLFTRDSSDPTPSTAEQAPAAQRPEGSDSGEPKQG